MAWVIFKALQKWGKFGHGQPYILCTGLTNVNALKYQAPKNVCLKHVEQRVPESRKQNWCNFGQQFDIHSKKFTN